MRVAAIDVGTNSTRLLVAEEQPGGFRSIDRRMVITRLGQGVDRTRVLAAEALDRTFRTIADYAATCGELGVERMRVTGTSAVRDAKNREEFFTGVKQLTGHLPELLTGDQEARATFLGTLSDLNEEGPVCVVDIGGGSTEFIVGTSEPERLVSLDVGCVRMYEKYLESDPPTSDELEALRAEVIDKLETVKPDLAVPKGARFIGVAGTVSQLAILKAGVPVYDPDVTHHAVLSHGDVRLIARRLSSLPYSKRKNVKGLEAGRVDVIVAGAEILLAVLEAFDVPEILTSEKDILDGLVIQLLSDGKTDITETL
ncbi:MAG: exopolyphosphatase [Actinomycetota bacterium]